MPAIYGNCISKTVKLTRAVRHRSKGPLLVPAANGHLDKSFFRKKKVT